MFSSQHAIGGNASGCDRLLMVPSGTAALEFAALLCGVSVGDEVCNCFPADDEHYVCIIPSSFYLYRNSYRAWQ